MAVKVTFLAVLVFSLAECVNPSPAVLLPTEWPEVELGSGMLQAGKTLNSLNATY